MSQFKYEWPESEGTEKYRYCLLQAPKKLISSSDIWFPLKVHSPRRSQANAVGSHLPACAVPDSVPNFYLAKCSIMLAPKNKITITLIFFSQM